jgi:flavin-dependent dehydrogenase
MSDKKAKIGIGSVLGENISEKFKQFLIEKKPGVRAYSPSSSLIPYGLPLTGIQKGNLALVGDAAFQNKATSPLPE